MDSPQTESLSLNAAYAFGIDHGLAAEIKAIRDMEIEWDRSYTSSLRRGFIVDLFEKHGIFDEFKMKHWTVGNTPTGASRRRRYLRIKQQYDEYLVDGGSETATEELEQEEERIEQAFAAEADLRDFLAKHPTTIELGLRIHQENDRRGIEYPVEGGFIDLLAIDRDGRFVVIELKLSRGRNKVLGQLLYYMGWVDEHLGKGKQPCRGIIIAKEITEDLKIAAKRVVGITLLRYDLSVTIQAP